MEQDLQLQPASGATPMVARDLRCAARRLLMAVVAALAMAGCGGTGGADESAIRPSSATATEASPQVKAHAAVAGEPDLVGVPGYEYADHDEGGSVLEMTKALVDSINEDVPGFVTGHSSHKVLKDGEHLLQLMILHVDEAAAGDIPRPLFIEGLLQYAVGSAFPTFGELTVAGEWVGAAQVSVEGENRVAYVWPGAESFVLVVGRSRPEAEAFVTGLINAYTG